jgi:cell division protein FtsQ
VVNGWIGAERWPLTRLRVHGQFERVDPALVRNVVLPHATRRLLRGAPAGTRRRDRKLPWVERAEYASAGPTCSK